jgi:trk system potassium uptake protein TrkA
MTVIGDAIDFDILHQAQIIKADAVVAVTNNDNINIMVAQIAHELFKVRMVIIRLYDPERECVYSESGIKTICPSLLSANEIFEIFSKKETQEEETDSVEEKE